MIQLIEYKYDQIINIIIEKHLLNLNPCNFGFV